MVYLVLGMHKSGTTLVAEILHKSQISMVDEVQSNLSYEGDKFERKTTNEINKELLKASHSLTWADQSLQCTDEQAGRIRQMIAVCENKYTAWGFKDPRTCLTYHIWKQILPDHKILIVYRNPYQVMAHYFNSTRRLDINYQDLMSREDILLYVADFVGQPLYDARDTRRYQRQKEQSMLYHLFEIFSGYQARKIYSRLEKYKSYA